MVKSALQAHRSQNLTGDLAAQSLPMLAKLSPDAEAAHYLDEAEVILRLQRNNLGLARVLCIRARKLHLDRDRNEITRLRIGTPALARCKVAREIVRRWDEWMNPTTAAGSVADYWGV